MVGGRHETSLAHLDHLRPLRGACRGGHRPRGVHCARPRTCRGEGATPGGPGRKPPARTLAHDSALAPLIAEESARPYFSYSPLYPAQRAFTNMFAEIQRGDVLVP